MPPEPLCPPSRKPAWPIAAAAALTGLGVVLGAFGAHALRPTLEATGRVSAWETAVLYHLLHGVALLAVGVWRENAPPDFAARLSRWAGGLWMGGVVLFSGSLYLLGVGGPRWLGPVTPFGGVLLIAGWGVLAVGAMRRRPPDNGR